jgi:hypothetical protein
VFTLGLASRRAVTSGAGADVERERPRGRARSGYRIAFSVGPACWRGCRGLRDDGKAGLCSGAGVIAVRRVDLSQISVRRQLVASWQRNPIVMLSWYGV